MARRARTLVLLSAAFRGRLQFAAAASSWRDGHHHSKIPLQAVLFDFDGSLVQSEESNRRAFSAVLNRDLDPDTWYGRCVGRRPADILEEYRSEDAPAVEELIPELKAEIARRHAEVEPTQGYSSFLGECQSSGLCMAIVSSGSRSYIENVVRNLGLDPHIRFIVAGDDKEVEGKHKPHPFPYLHAAERLGVAPECCLAVEDSPSGIRSAIAAGMRVVVIRNPAIDNHELLGNDAVIATVDHFDALRATPLWQALLSHASVAA